MADKQLKIGVKIVVTEAMTSADLIAKKLGKVKDATLEAAKAAETAVKKQAASIEALTDRHIKREYDQRIAFERKKQLLSEATAKKAAADAAKKNHQIEAIESSFIARDYRARVAAEAKKLAETEKANAKAIALKKRESDAIAREADRKAQQITAIEDRLLKRDYANRVAHERRKEEATAASYAKQGRDNERHIDKMLTGIRRHDAAWKKSLTDEDVQRMVINQKTINANKKRVDAAMKAAGVEAKGFRDLSISAKDAFGMVTNLAGAFGLVTTAASGISALAGEYDRITKSQIDAIKFSNEYRDSLLELAALKGHLGQGGKETGESMAFRAKTLQSLPDSTRFQGSALNVGQSAMDNAATGFKGNISKEEFTKAMELGGAFQAAEGGDADTHGKLIGMLPALMGRRVTGKEVAAQESKLYDIFQLGGAQFGNMAAGYMKNAAYAKTGVISPDRLAALESAFSVDKPEEHATETEQFIRATKGGIGKLRGVKVEGDSEKVGQYLKRIGADEKMDPIEIGKKISADLTKQEEAGKDPLVYLQSRGYGNMQDRQSILAFHALQKSGQFQQFEELAGKSASSSKVNEAVARFQNAAPEGRARKAALAAEMGKIAETDPAQEYYDRLMETTFNKLKAGKATVALGFQLSGEWKDIAEASSLNPMAKMRQDMVYKYARRALDTEAKRVGVNKVAVRPGEAPVDLEQAGPPTNASRAKQAEFLYNESRLVGQAGGDTLPGMKELLALMNKQLTATEKQTDIITKGQAKATPPVPILPVGKANFLRVAGMLRL